MTIRERTTYDVSCDHLGCPNALIDITEPTEHLTEEGWTAVLLSGGIGGVELHLCPDCQ